jgi:hypothetical protein
MLSQDANLARQGGKPATNHFSYGMAKAGLSAYVLSTFEPVEGF